MFVTPDFSHFIKRVGTTDLARQNLFLVRFGDFRSVIGNDGIIGIADAIYQDAKGFQDADGLFDGLSNSWSYLTRAAKSSAYKHLPPYAKRILHASQEGGYGDAIHSLLGVSLPEVIGTQYQINNDFALMVKSVNFPERTLDVTTNKTNKRPFGEVRGGQTGTITMTCYCSPDFIERRLMLMWMNSIHDERRQQYGFHDNYAKEITVVALDRKGQPSHGVACFGCFPTRVGQVQFDTDSNNQVATFEVEFYVSHQQQINTLLRQTIGQLL